MLQRGSLPSEIALQGRSLKSKMVYRGVGAECGLRKTEKIFSANNQQGTMKRGEKWFRSPHLPLDTPRKAGFPFATRARKREPCPQRYVSRMIRTENFLSQIFFKVFLETTFFHFSWYPVHYQPKIFFSCLKSALTLIYVVYHCSWTFYY